MRNTRDFGQVAGGNVEGSIFPSVLSVADPGCVWLRKMALPKGQVMCQAFLHSHTIFVNLDSELHNAFSSSWSCSFTPTLSESLHWCATTLMHSLLTVPYLSCPLLRCEV